jgi:N4-gp56 family major capsid protein
MADITTSTTSADQEKMLAAKLLKRSYLKLVFASLADKVSMMKGAGLTAYFIRYRRMNVPLSVISEGVDPSSSSFSLDTVTVTLDQWGDVITVTDRAVLTTSHPLIQQATELLADNAARVMDREIQLVLLAGTNIQYGDGSVATRRTITSAMVMNETVSTKARVTMVDAGAPPRGGPSGDAKQVQAQGSFNAGQAYIAVCGPNVIGDIMRPGSSYGTFVAVATYANQKALYNSEIGTWLNFRWVETNFIPKFTLLGNGTTAAATGSDAGGITGLTLAVASGGSGTLSNATYYWKVTRKDLLRGFEEAISIEHSTATGAGTSYFTFTMPSTAGYVYNVYLGSSTGDTNLKLAVENAAASSANVINAVSSSTTTPPDNIIADGTVSAVHPIFLFAAEALAWVGFYDIQVMMTPDASLPGNILKLKRSIGYKFYGKAMIKDQTRILRMEVASNY